MIQHAIQDYYPDDVNHCFGCGQLNEHGHKIRTFWEGDVTVTRFTPKPFHTAIPGFVYGGLLASLIDCHGTGTAAAAACKAAGMQMEGLPALRFVTASLKINYLKPTPLGPELIMKGSIKDIKGKKITVSVDLFAEGLCCVQAEVIAVQIPEHWGKK